jgi:hypothetical protein
MNTTILIEMMVLNTTEYKSIKKKGDELGKSNNARINEKSC